MIAPSSDWFIGLNSFDLQNGSGEWITSASIDLNSYDAGTESGSDFALSGPTHFDTNDNIQLLDDAEPTGALASVGSIATIQFTRVAAVPEPTSTSLLGLASLALVLRRKRQ